MVLPCHAGPCRHSHPLQLILIMITFNLASCRLVRRCQGLSQSLGPLLGRSATQPRASPLSSLQKLVMTAVRHEVELTLLQSVKLELTRTLIQEQRLLHKHRTAHRLQKPQQFIGHAPTASHINNWARCSHRKHTGSASLARAAPLFRHRLCR